MGATATFMLNTPDVENLPSHWLEPEDVPTTPPAPDAPGPWIVFGVPPPAVEAGSSSTRVREIVCVPQAMMTLPPPVPDDAVAVWVIPIPADTSVPDEGDPCPATP